MADSARIEDLRRRVQKDPASIAFAQLAEECRRAGNFDEAVEVCRAGLQIHPGYLSARVTLGRTLIEMNDLDSAIGELEHVLRSAPENLAAIRGLAEIHHRQGNLVQALQQYRAALALARNDPDLQQTVDELTHQLEPPAPEAVESTSFETAEDEFLKSLSSPIADDVAEAEAPASPTTSYYGTAIEAVEPEEVIPEPPEAASPAASASTASIFAALAPPPAPTAPPPEPPAAEPPAPIQEPVAISSYWDTLSAPAAPAPAAPAVVEPPDEGPVADLVVEPFDVEEQAGDPAAREQALQMIAVLEQWLDAIHVARAQPHA